VRKKLLKPLMVMDVGEEELAKTQAALSKKHGIKCYEKVVEKIGRLKERFKRVVRRYEIEIARDEKTNLATKIAWERRKQNNRSGFLMPPFRPSLVQRAGVI
jgi:hypothetical protein